jgi:hypothetical protein
MSNKQQFKKNLRGWLRIRPLVFYANLNKYLDEEWQVTQVTDDFFQVHNPINGYTANIGHDARREWIADFSKNDGVVRGTVILKAQITLRDYNSVIDPITDSLLTAKLKRIADVR